MPPIIEVHDLSKVYKVGTERVRALSHINLTIDKGEICCIFGVSGSGKSTLLNQLAGLEKPSGGYVRIGKHIISKMSENELALFRQEHIGFIFQSYNLFGTMTALENTAAPLLYRGVPKKKREAAAKKILQEVGLGARLNHLAGQMSGGQQQRVGIARAFVARPAIVFADEPTGNLDSRTTVEVMEMLVRMAREYNITFILVTHNNELADYADRIITIKDGQLVGDVRKPPRPETLTAPPSEETTAPAAEEAAPASPEEAKPEPAENLQTPETFTPPEAANEQQTGGENQ